MKFLNKNLKKEILRLFFAIMLASVILTLSNLLFEKLIILIIFSMGFFFTIRFFDKESKWPILRLFTILTIINTAYLPITYAAVSLSCFLGFDANICKSAKFEQIMILEYAVAFIPFFIVFLLISLEWISRWWRYKYL
jgi:hypothetical protein